ncbi:hypothetical protein [Streptomyces caeruleatus]|uniref:hypothetical protein n=1 Tax=Streptomyces caeruleatus TaxID=661399 RepID=UPI0007C636C8|nr:hypothetical protein [Streptomyces caeruleatus]
MPEVRQALVSDDGTIVECVQQWWGDSEAGRQEVRAITSPADTGSIAFHRAMGFDLEEGDREVDGLPVHSDYDGPGQDRVCFHKKIASPAEASAVRSCAGSATQ